MSDEKRWTPGPWLIDGATVYALNDEGTNRFSAQVHRGWVVDRPNHIWATLIQEQNANAHLIAAAPELYGALEEALEELEGYDQDIGGEGYNNPRINAVLAKARGENPDE